LVRRPIPQLGTTQKWVAKHLLDKGDIPADSEPLIPEQQTQVTPSDPSSGDAGKVAANSEVILSPASIAQMPLDILPCFQAQSKVVNCKRRKVGSEEMEPDSDSEIPEESVDLSGCGEVQIEVLLPGVVETQNGVHTRSFLQRARPHFPRKEGQTL
jgi:hypothetical protein